MLIGTMLLMVATSVHLKSCTPDLRKLEMPKAIGNLSSIFRSSLKLYEWRSVCKFGLPDHKKCSQFLSC